MFWMFYSAKWMIWMQYFRKLNKINAIKWKVSDMGDLNEILGLVNEMDGKNKLVEYFNAILFLWKIWIQNNFGGRFGCIYIEMQVLKCRKIKKSGDTYRCIPQFCTDKRMQKVFWGQWVVNVGRCKYNVRCTDGQVMCLSVPLWQTPRAHFNKIII